MSTVDSAPASKFSRSKSCAPQFTSGPEHCTMPSLLGNGRAQVGPKPRLPCATMRLCNRDGISYPCPMRIYWSRRSLFERLRRSSSLWVIAWIVLLLRVGIAAGVIPHAPEHAATVVESSISTAGDSHVGEADPQVASSSDHALAGCQECSCHHPAAVMPTAIKPIASEQGRVPLPDRSVRDYVVPPWRELRPPIA